MKNAKSLKEYTHTHTHTHTHTGNSREGITLVALVITIIILLILAGISINFIFGNEGIFSKTQMATQKYKNAQEEEEAMIAKYENKIDCVNTREITEEEYNAMFFPNKQIEITAFDATTTNQTYTIPRNGWLVIDVTGCQYGNTIVFYRNDMNIFSFGACGDWLAGNGCYIPVKKGDIIKKTQNGGGFHIYAWLHYYEK